MSCASSLWNQVSALLNQCRACSGLALARDHVDRNRIHRVCNGPFGTSGYGLCTVYMCNLNGFCQFMGKMALSMAPLNQVLSSDLVG